MMPVNFSDALSLYDKKYNMFNVNRKYRRLSFSSDEEYEAAQNILAKEISQIDARVEESLRRAITKSEKQYDVQLLLFDSRFSSFNDNCIGKILCKNIETQSGILELSELIEMMTGISVIIERYEDLSDEARKIIDGILERKNASLTKEDF